MVTDNIVEYETFSHMKSFSNGPLFGASVRWQSLHYNNETGLRMQSVCRQGSYLVFENSRRFFDFKLFLVPDYQTSQKDKVYTKQTYWSWLKGWRGEVRTLFLYW